jgi:hypothetical protein
LTDIDIRWVGNSDIQLKNGRLSPPTLGSIPSVQSTVDSRAEQHRRHPLTMSNVIKIRPFQGMSDCGEDPEEYIDDVDMAAEAWEANKGEAAVLEKSLLRFFRQNLEPNFEAAWWWQGLSKEDRSSWETVKKHCRHAIMDWLQVASNALWRHSSATSSTGRRTLCWEGNPTSLLSGVERREPGVSTFSSRNPNRVAQTAFILFSTFLDLRPASDASD